MPIDHRVYVGHWTPLGENDLTDAKTLPAVIPVVLHQGRKAWDAPRPLAELIDLPPELLEVVGRYVPGLDFALQDLGPRSSAELAKFPGPPLVRLTLSFMRVIADPDENPLAALDGLEATLKELLAQPGGPARLAIVLRYTVLPDRSSTCASSRRSSGVSQDPKLVRSS